MFAHMKTEVRNILMECIDITYFMRGGIQYADLLQRTPNERELMKAYLDDRLDQERGRMHPNY